MKNNKPVSALLILFCGILFLSSCGSFKDQFSHQRYTNFKVKHEVNYAKQEVSTNVTVPSDYKKEEGSTRVSSSGNVVASADTKIGKVETAEKELRQNNLNSARTKEKEAVKLENRLNFNKLFSHAIPERNDGDSGDANQILLIVLCIFLPPLACYLKDGNVSTAFWATLILCILSLSFFFFVDAGLLWLVAMIIAFIHCFKK